MNYENSAKAVEAIEKFKTLDKKLLSVYDRGYLGKKSYEVTLNDGTKNPCDQLTKKSGNGNGDAVVIVPITKEGNYVMVVQSRPNTYETVAIEFPAGMVDSDEAHLNSAVRELLEETGYKVGNIAKLESHYQDQGCSKAVIDTYIATGCEKVAKQHLDENERLYYVEFSKRDVEELMGIANPTYACFLGDRITEIGLDIMIRFAKLLGTESGLKILETKKAKQSLITKNKELLKEIGIRDANSRIAYMSLQLTSNKK